ncbi:PucR family transcriptional regulator [Rhodococcus sp. G-MC3]|uniref:PucR family transcriptional regulator n=1 Tax=Rhodococcus sp. G-MC3 TaxID=3046209 RepID=UPI0024B98AA9|nr:PucR family transcriptional regulator [Rhodococcus sp. G-MC3]MDJ0395877.1 PucR family transcriptional regulator [Rhodococcus sp. G-MC3]
MQVKDLLDIADFGIRMLTSDPAALERTVRWTFTTDLPDPSRYIAGGELVITGLMWRHCAADSAIFVQAVFDSGAAALAAGEGLLGHIPDDLVEACERHGLPLLAIPDSVSFNEVTEFLVGRVSGDRIAALNSSLTRQRQLLTAIAEGRALDELALHTTRETGMQCLIFTATGRRLVVEAHPFSDADVDSLTHRALSAERLPATVTLDGGRTYSIFGIGASLSTRAMRWFVAVAGDFEAFDPSIADAFGQLASIAALDRARREEGRLVRREIADQAVHLLEEDWSKAETLVRLRQAGVDPDHPIVVISASFVGRGDMRELLRTVLSDTLTSFGGGCVGGGSKGDVVGIVATKGVDIVPILRTRLRRLAPGIGRSRLVVGVSSEVTGTALEGAIHAARHASTVALSSDRQVAVVAAGDLHSALSLVSILPDRVRREYTQRVLGPLLDYNTDSGLVETLREFLAHGGSWNRTAEVLHVHLNTVRYRIKRIEELLGRDLGSTADRLDVFLALQSIGPADTRA